MLSISAKSLLIYGCVIAFGLYSFWLYQVCSLGMSNITSNEDIRHRWNGHYRNRKPIRAFKSEAGCCGRLAFLLCGNVDKVHGPSKLDAYAEYLMNRQEIKRLE